MITYPERNVADSFGLTLPALRDMRKTTPEFVEGTDYHRVGKTIEWTESGLENLTRILEIKKNAARPPAAPPPPAAVTLVVDRIVPNPAFVMVRAMAADGAPVGGLLRLRVTNNRNFMPGMQVANCRPVPGSPDLYHHEGRCPRHRGRW